MDARELAELGPVLREEMRRALLVEDGEPEEFYGYMQYALGWTDERLSPSADAGGKMLRPRLCLLACEAAGGDARAAVPAAAAVELLHNFTLVHDDIQDNSPQRRHRPSVWKLVGVPRAIGVGDGIFAASHRALESLDGGGVEPGLVVHALREFDLTTLRVCEGQHMDLSFERRDSVPLEEYLAMITRKTGALMGLSCYLGALVADAPPEARELYRAFGERLGVAYQIRDDLRGVWQTESGTGKRAMEDVYSRKKSYPAVRAFELATGEDAARLRSIYSDGEVSESDALWTRELMDRLGIREEGLARVREYASSATEALEHTGTDASRLEEFGWSLLGLKS